MRQLLGEPGPSQSPKADTLCVSYSSCCWENKDSDINSLGLESFTEEEFILTHLFKGLIHHGRGGVAEQTQWFMSGKQKKEACWSLAGVLPSILFHLGAQPTEQCPLAAGWVLPLRKSSPETSFLGNSQNPHLQGESKT